MNAIIQSTAPQKNSHTANQAFINQLIPSRTVKRVLLVNPPDADAPLFQRDTAARGRYTNYPPMAC